MGDNPNPSIEANLAASGRFSGYEIFDLQAVPLPAHMDYASGADGGSSELIAAADAQVLQQYHEPDDSGGHGMEKRRCRPILTIGESPEGRPAQAGGNQLNTVVPGRGLHV
ncbi:hypothetical protein BHE74_00029623 [Ensete ventricosum]|nr:hypothetical protein GW17_00047737 [Ensete ventricosum]RWW63211.1 hypothetical protein BHE74_00029623 [Ensete ventricosum]RZS08195.1 hypothetical protein BHM03_00039138 [Ensete ventricosum]